MKRIHFQSAQGALEYERKNHCYCPECDKQECIHREAYRRMPIEVGGLGECPRLPVHQRKK